MQDTHTFTTTASPKKEAVSSDSGSQPEQEPIATLLGSISYSNDADWEAFLNSMSIHQGIVVLIASANYAQKRGAYNLAEAELIAKAIKTLTKAEVEARAADIKEPIDTPEKE